MILICLYFIENYSKNNTNGKILWIYDYNNHIISLEKYFIPFLTTFVYVLAFIIPCYFRNILGILYLLLILSRSYLSLKFRINFHSTILIIFYFAFFITRNIWPTETLYVSFILDPVTASFDFILAILLVDLLHDLGSFIHMYIKLKEKNLRIIKKQSSIYKEMINSTPRQSHFKNYYLNNYERITNKNFKKINSSFVKNFFDKQIKMNCIFVNDEIPNQLYDENENKVYAENELQQKFLIHDFPILEEENQKEHEQEHEHEHEQEPKEEETIQENKNENLEEENDKPVEDEKKEITKIKLNKEEREEIRNKYKSRNRSFKELFYKFWKRTYVIFSNFQFIETILNILGCDLVFYLYIGKYLIFSILCSLFQI